MPLGSRTPKNAPVSIEILTNGKPIDDKIAVSSIEVDRAVNKVSEARVVLLLRKTGGEELEVTESASFVPGMAIEIKAGFDTRLQTIFKGIITSLRLRSGKLGAAQVQLFCSDEAVKMTLGRKSRVFSDMKDSDAFTSIIDDYGLRGAVGDTAVLHPELVQYHATDWDFIISRAEVNGQILTNRDGNIKVDRPDVTSAPVIKVTNGEDLLGFDLELDAQSQMVHVVSRAWDAGRQELSEEQSQEPVVNDQGNISGLELAEVLKVSDFRQQSSGFIDREELKSWADAGLLKARMARIKGTLEFSGSDLIYPDTVIEVEGLGERFNGQAYVSGVTHSLKLGTWQTKIAVGLAAEWFVSKDSGAEASSAAGLLPGMNGLHIGTVRKTDGDPMGLGRVQVDLPLIAPDGAIWARPSNFYATSGKGAFFLPEVDDEVVVGFLNDDPRFPVIMGSLYSSRAQPPYQAGAANAIKAIVSRNGLKVEFNDQDKVLTIGTPAKNEFILSDKDKKITLQDQNGNRIEMSSAGITLSSTKDVTIKAGGHVKLEGMNVTAKAQAAFSAEGSASAELSAAGQTTIKGAMVMIN